jgi:hypothetical protein
LPLDNRIYYYYILYHYFSRCNKTSIFYVVYVTIA